MFKNVISWIRELSSKATPLYKVLFLFMAWWVIVLFAQSHAENTLPTWRTLILYHSEAHWQVAWSVMLIAQIVSFFYPGFWFKQFVHVAAAALWLYTGYI